MADNYAVKDGTGAALTKASKDLGAGVQADKQVAVDSAGAEILGTTTGAAVITDANGSVQQYLRGLVKLWIGGLAAGAAIIGKVGIDQTTPGTTNLVAAGVADGADVTQGAKADTLYTGGVGSWSIVALLKGIYAQLIAPTPAGTNLIGSVTVAPSTTAVTVTPTVTASAYTAGNVIGGIMTFASALAPVNFNGVIQSISAKFKGAAVSGALQIAIFKASPSSGTYTDKTAPTWNAADMANLLGVYTLTAPVSALGAMTIYNLDGIGKGVVGASQSLYAVAIVNGTPTPASTSDFSLELAVLPG